MQQDDTSLWKPSLDNCRCGNLSVSLDEGLNKIMEGRDNLVLSGETPVTHRHHPCDEIHHSEPSLAWDNINGSQPKICNVVATKALENVLKPLQTYGSESESEESSSQHTDKLPLFSDNQ